MTTPTFKPPGTLKPDTARWWRKVAADYVLEEHHLRLLTLAAYAWVYVVRIFGTISHLNAENI